MPCVCAGALSTSTNAMNIAILHNETKLEYNFITAGIEEFEIQKPVRLR